MSIQEIHASLAATVCRLGADWTWVPVSVSNRTFRFAPQHLRQTVEIAIMLNDGADETCVWGCALAVDRQQWNIADPYVGDQIAVLAECVFRVYINGCVARVVALDERLIGTLGVGRIKTSTTFYGVVIGIDPELGEFTPTNSIEPTDRAVVEVDGDIYYVRYDVAQFDTNIVPDGWTEPGDLTLYRVIDGDRYPVVKLVRAREPGTTRRPPIPLSDDR